MTVRVAETAELTTSDLGAVRELMRDAFVDAFTEEDWRNSLGGRHVIVELDGVIVSHGAVVARTLEADGRTLRAGYVEGVATHPGRRREGWARAVMHAINGIIERDYEIGGLSTGVPELYLGLGWEPWRGPTAVTGPAGTQRTPDDDGGVMVLRTGRTPDIDLSGVITYEWREGEVW
jgi:aminoglycoside 2'-N-acetyltransferase I